MNARRGRVAGVPVRTPAWDRTGCQEQVCTCHDDTAPAYSCSACGCRARETREDPRMKICGTCGDLRSRCTGDEDTYEEGGES